jgi:LPXTG-motif cell wall-anchored protein
VQQLAETGYGGMVALMGGVILAIVGIGGLIFGRRRH